MSKCIDSLDIHKWLLFVQKSKDIFEQNLLFNMNPPTHDLNTLQMKFLSTLMQWINGGTSPVPAQMHFPHIVCLLQSVGFYIRRIDSSGPQNVTPLRNNKKGTRVVITCGHSGNRCFLELPETPEQCTCLYKSNDSMFSEVIGMQNSVAESCSHVAPPLSWQLNYLLKTVLTILIHFIQGTSAKEDNVMNSTATSSPNIDAKRLSGFISEIMGPIITFTSPDNKEPTILKSLDKSFTTPDKSLTTPNQKESEPPLPLLQTSPNLSQSSPDLSVKKDAVSNQPIPSNLNNKEVIQMLRKSITMLKKKKDLSPKPVPFPINKTKSASSPNLACKKKTVSPIPGKTPASRTPAKPLTAKPSAAKLPVKTTSTASVRTPNRVEPKKPDDLNKNIAAKPKNAYAHVKSTIPKPMSATKVVTKK